MGFTESELTRIADEHFQGYDPPCPRCNSTKLTVHRTKSLGQKTATLLVHCRRCGEDGTYSTAHLAAMDLEWNRTQKLKIVDDYWQNGIAKCPNDNTVLDVSEIRSISSSKTPILANCARCGRYLNSDQIPPDPDSFEAKYDVLEPIGQGGMGFVSKIKRKSDGEILVAKKILPEYLNYVEAVRRFQREIRIMSESSHGNIVPIYDGEISDEGGIIIMKYMCGGDFSTFINNSDIPLGTLVDIYFDVVEGLSYLHEKQVVHRDLKPHNILIDENNRGYVSDFGLAVLLNRDTTPLTSYGRAVGTDHYAAPEQLISARDVDFKADLYAMGLIAYEIVTRTCPYISPVRFRQDSIFDSIEAAIHPEPSNRNITLHELADSLRQYQLETSEA